MKSLYFLLVLVHYLSVLASEIQADNELTSLISGNEFLDSEGKYWVQWNISQDESTIYFQIKAETRGYVGFGISPSGGMTGADILIVGVNPDGSIYSSDRHAIGNQEPVLDPIQNWVVTSAIETENHTTIRFHRLLNTCDNNDMKITDATMRLIWAMGQSDTLSYHGVNKGTKSVNLYLNGNEDFQPEKYKTFDITTSMEMPALHTSYWCSIHQAPLFYQRQHIVAIEPVLPNIDAIRHTHHFIFYRCQAPENLNPDNIFLPWVGHPGDHCFSPGNSSFPFLSYCSLYITYIWSKGGKRLIFPSNLGLPMPETLGQNEYYALEVHYDNPEVLPGVKFQTGGRIYYTEQLRNEEVGLLLLNQKVQVQLAIPPKSANFVVNGHCSSECTLKWVPPEGVTIFNNLFHAHLAGRKMKLRHFRGNLELPWIDVDDYYDFDFQQNKPLTRVRKLERGDQLTVECTMNTMNVEGGKAVIGGLSTREEMCESTMYYYPRQNVTFCNSGQDLDEHFRVLGVTNYTRHDNPIPGGIPEYEILSPTHLKGDYLTSLSFKINWTSDYRDYFQYQKRYGVQIGGCFGNDFSYQGDVKYPENLKEYTPPNECASKKIVIITN